MRELNIAELHSISGGHGSKLLTAFATGAITTLIGWASIVCYKGVTYQLQKLDNIALVGSLGGMVGVISFIGGTII
jgi:hypothetical protein